MRDRLRSISIIALLLVSSAILAWWWHTPAGPWLVHQQPLAGQRICVIGDAGWGNPPALAVGKALVQLECDQIRYLGDLVYPDGISGPDDPLIEERFLPPLRPALAAGIPVYLVLGNHDWKQDGEAWLKVARRHPLIHLPHFYYFETWPDACAFSLETTWFEKWYHLHRQGNWLDNSRELARQHQCQLSLGFAHHPMFSTGSHGNAHEMINLGLKNKLVGSLDLIVGGHDHILSDEGEYRGTRQLISGSASINNDLGIASANQAFTRATHGLLTLDIQDDGDGLYVDYRFYSVLGDPQAPLISLLWQGDQQGKGVR
ncbi:metallophosphoesterase [Alcanivorax sp. DP30]|uniref:metallophosphoesterase n=1 Tax=Alcanivorax sp. DP30 TaxID=2606217 RepID=UPI00136DB794|nr:metallophosphoesterase [Alcanivorax sp. DP30]MZR62596.1 serine/threonine protein phosphatase [Alcanivorax sp. DP30]